MIDNGKKIDFGRTAEDYAKYRDIYPAVFYEKVTERGLCLKGQAVLDIGTGTGVLPRNMYLYGAKWVGTDISDRQTAFHLYGLMIERDPIGGVLLVGLLLNLYICKLSVKR